MPVVYNAAQARFRDTATGKFVSQKTVTTLLQESITSSAKEMQALAKSYSEGKITLKAFGNAFKEEIKQEHIRQYIIGKGGLGSMTNSDWGKLGSTIKGQYSYANGLLDEIKDLSSAQLNARVALYANASGVSFQQGKQRAIKESGKFTKEQWILGGSVQPCDDCKRLASLGWQDLGSLITLPGAGGTQCKSQCKCTVNYK